MSDMQCAISGLPISGPGGRAYWLILGQNPIASEGGGTWVPRTWPIACTLGDYGSPSRVPEGPLRDVILQALEVDVVETGPGTRTWDGPVQKGMDFATMLKHLGQERLFVWDGGHRDRFEREGEPAPEPADPLAPYYPSRANVQAALEALGDSDWAVDEREGGCSVRPGALHTRPSVVELLPAREALSPRFATVVVAGNYGPELYVFTAPWSVPYGSSPMALRAYAPREPKRLALRSAFIKAEVWEALVRARVDGISSVGDYTEDIQCALNAWPWLNQERSAQFSRFPALARLEWGGLVREHPRARRVLPGLSSLTGESLLPLHALLLYDRGGWDGAFAALVAEFSRICDIMGATRRAWAPSAMVGDLGMLRDLRPFSQVMRVIDGVAARQLKKRGEELRAENRRYRAYLAKHKKT